MSLRRLTTACLATAAVAVAAVLLGVPAGATPPLPGERIAAGVTAAGLDLAGLTVEQAAHKIQGSYGPRMEAGSVTVKASDLTWRLKAADARVRLDTMRSAKRALYAGRSAGGRAVDVDLAMSYSWGTVNRFARKIDKRLRRRPRDSKLKISVQRVRITHSRRGRDIDHRKLTRAVSAALKDPRLGRVVKPTVLRPKPKVTAGVLRKQASTVLTIHQATFTLRLFKNLKVVKRYRVAVGQPSYPTPRGLYRIQNKQVNPVWSVPNSPWAGELAGTTVSGGSAANPLKARWMGIVNGVGIHGTGQGASIGSRASHGCIRMHVPDVIALFKRVPVGTQILIA